MLGATFLKSWVGKLYFLSYHGYCDRICDFFDTLFETHINTKKIARSEYEFRCFWILQAKNFAVGIEKNATLISECFGKEHNNT